MRSTSYTILLAMIGCCTILSPSVPAEDLPRELHRAMFVRNDQAGREVGEDQVDPLLWPNSKYLLTDPRYAELVRLLHQVELSDADTIDPVRRALVQHELWTVFDWTDGLDDARANSLRPLLAGAIRKLALTPAQAAALPDNFAATVASKTFPAAYDDAQPNRSFLPPDLFDPNGPWVCLTMPGRASGVVATHHAKQFSRSAFLVFINLPGGRQATLDYLRTLSLLPRPFELSEPPFSTRGSVKERKDAIEFSNELPQFAVGTQVALVRRMLVLDAAGNPLPTPLVQNIQFRVYRLIADAQQFISSARARQFQSFFEFALDRPDKLRAVQSDEQAYVTLMGITGNRDRFEAPADQQAHQFTTPVLETCAACHERGGIYSVNSIVTARFGPLDLNPQPTPTSPRDEVNRAIGHKKRQHDLGVLQGLLQAR